jgi:hypothetical protein
MVTAAAMRGGWFRRRGDRAGGWSIAAIERNPQSLTAKASALSGRGFSAGFGEMEPVSAFLQFLFMQFLLDCGAIGRRGETICIPLT